MEFALLGWPVDEPRLRLDYRRFSYAGKFVTGKTGIAVVRGEPPADHESTSVDSLGPLPEDLSESEFDDGILAAVAFNADRTDPKALWLRYLTVRSDLRGSGLELGPRLAAFIKARAAERGYTTVRIAVNNVFSYHALYKSGFAATGRETGLAELILEAPTDAQANVSMSTYQCGLDQFRKREGLSDAEETFLQEHESVDPPEPIHTGRSAQHVDSGVSNPPGTSE
ncbi:hypothetical protein halTADL_0156 [Halohasta litchfieldiae]|jgi:hypothetical protein|uniref:N-acetyltransferase domain-containing protein n=1 Tax=Halohasta litchfieldiae TaxID=1073996 RepID=A0A1H6SVA4_9EURY|nr:GNAT family N-acetyltransferase [Halohasta litchfieldiae]ATW86978.1 hypothetical protein halTADL_0156 [Halohasta litchfieldiae]SEI71691.1 hypothetical protein SAMN05444271_10687 [Halohasta litchfieldiae]